MLVSLLPVFGAKCLLMWCFCSERPTDHLSNAHNSGEERHGSDLYAQPVVPNLFYINIIELRGNVSFGWLYVSMWPQPTEKHIFQLFSIALP